MEKHLSLIFYFLINIVIFTSASNVGDLYEPSENNAIDPFENSQIDVGELNDDGHLIRVKRNFNHITGRHEQPYSFERENESENADANDDNSDMNNDETIRYYLNSIKERDVNGQLEKSTSETFNDSQSATTATANNKIDSDLSKTFINNTFVERPAASSSTEPNSKSTEYVSVIAILDQMREELELLRMSKQCNSTPDGSNCEVNGSWNSEQIGLRVELVNSMTDDKLTVKLSDKAPKKFSPFKIDSSWSCSGMVFRSIGGPIYFHCLKLPMETIAIFHGMCKKCSGYETIFGQWHFQHNPKECRQLWTFFETKNDIFRKDVLHSSNHDNANINHATSQTNAKSMNGSEAIAAHNKSKKRRHINSNQHKLMQELIRGFP